jgi:nucleoside-diphosphate-sugar epimerase
MQRRLPSIAKAHASFGFQPRRNLHQVLAEVIPDLRARLDGSHAAIAPNP